MFINSSLKSCACQSLLPNQLLQEDKIFTMQTNACTSLVELNRSNNPLHPWETSTSVKNQMLYSCLQHLPPVAVRSQLTVLTRVPLNKCPYLLPPKKQNKTKQKQKSIIPSPAIAGCH